MTFWDVQSFAKLIRIAILGLATIRQSSMLF